jgi:UDP-glucose 4-epimerase
MRILITGAAGFIGSHLARRLMREGHEIISVDNLTTGRRDNMPEGVEFINLDLAGDDFVRSLPGGRFDVVCHLAAQSSGEISGEDPVYDVRANALSTLQLSRWCLVNRIPRFLYASSMAVYGDPTRQPVMETDACSPLSFYGISKLASEHFLSLAAREGLSTTSFRMFSVYGPGQNMDNLKQGMVSIFMSYMLKSQEVPVKGSLQRFRDFIFIDDIVDAWVKALHMPLTKSPVYNLGSGRGTTVEKLLSALKRALQLRPDYPVKELSGSRSDQFGLQADIHRAQSELGWHPQVDLDIGVGRMAEWAQSVLEGIR